MDFKEPIGIKLSTVIHRTVVSAITGCAILFFSAVDAQTSSDGEIIPPMLLLLLFDDPEFSIESTEIAEGDTGSKLLRLTVRLSSFAESTVDFIYPDGATAVVGSDYNRPPAGTLTFSGGVTEATIDFEIIGDTVFEQNEFFIVELVNPVGAEISDRNRSIVTIIDEDSALNDTGVDYGAETTSNNFDSCTVTTTALEQQDCANGRDALQLARQLTKLGTGPNGFDYTKLGMDGRPLTIQTAAYAITGSEAAGTKWACVRDNHTGLVWEVKEASGIHASTTEYRWGGLTAIGINRPDRLGDYFPDWNVLVNSANNTARCGITDWRVPDLKSLSSLINYAANRANALSLSGPFINSDFFPFVNRVGSSYWSASPFNLNNSSAYTINFQNGSDDNEVRNDQRLVRIVAGRRLETIGHATAIANGDQEVLSYIDNTTPDSRYLTGATNVTVVDRITGLMWQRCVVGQTGVNCNVGSATEFNWGTAAAIAQSSVVGGFTDWRLPSIQEYRSLSALDRRGPAINTTIFPNTPNNSSEYWSSTPNLGPINNAVWVGEPDSGTTTGIRSSSTASRIIRLVRDGQ